jgi:3-oxoacyl-[acyl-carrier protein] reductase
MSDARVALVTGASRGIGAAIAARLVRDGYRVWLGGRDSSVLAARAAQLAEAGPGAAQPLVLDVADASSIAAAFRVVHTDSRRLDVLVNNAGIMDDALTGMLQPAALERTLATNVSGTVLCQQAAARLMQRQKRGSIVNVSSVMATHGTAGKIAYAASKAAVEGATRAAARELAPWGIRVNAVAPGWVETDLLATLTDAQRTQARERTPLGRAGTANEIAAVVAFLAGDEAAYVTGAIVPVDGGYVP